MNPESITPVADLEPTRSFETLLTGLLAGFINIRAEAVDGAIENAQRHICEALGLDRSTLFQFQEPSRELAITHCWARPDLTLNPMGPAGAIYPWEVRQILAGHAIQFSSVDDLPLEAAVDKETILRLGPKSDLILPLAAGGKILGAVAFGSMLAERQWPETLVARLRFIAEILASALSRQAGDAALGRAYEELGILKQKLQQENAYLRQEVKEIRGQKRLVGKSAALRRVLLKIDQVAPTQSTVLLQGDTGTGKELIAAAIHELSPRSARPMVTANLAAIPATLIESELFGREKGAYTGALTRQAGCFELASGSTIFLDEISELPPDMQVKLLRVLQEKQIQRLGGVKPLNIDIRVIAATNRDLRKLVDEGKFREDLYYRLNVFPIQAPPLRERRDDIPDLVWSFVAEFGAQLSKRIKKIDQVSLDRLQAYAWPGNIRELRNVIERAMIISTKSTLKVELPDAGAHTTFRSMAIHEIEREHIRQVLQQTAWRIRGKNGAAALLDLKPTTLEFRITKLGLQRPRSRQT